MKLIYSLLIAFLFFSPSVSNAKDLDSYGADCKEIGFKPKTTDYGDCVLVLRKRDQTSSIQQSSSQRQNVVQTPVQQPPRGDGTADDASCQRYGFAPQTDAYAQCRMQLDNVKKQLQVQQAQYVEQRRVYEQQQAQYEKEKNRREGLELLRYGSALASGTSPYASENFANANAQVYGTAPVAPRPLPQSYTITMPNNKMMNCTFINNIMNCL